ncbi:DUF7269 family protein [Halostella litorea]|uniref:DUF7269 family protein n=1 Tax=Halostella litorea TaxID=2528831 RepID=UPI0010924FEF|nr:hypothetical protein [Halostella litorea]
MPSTAEFDPVALARRGLLAVAALLAAVAAVAALAGPDALGRPLADAADPGSLVAAAFATVGITLGALLATLSWLPALEDDGSTRPPEEATATPYPGSSLDSAAGGLGLAPGLYGADRRAVRERLRETAVRTTMAAEGCSREAALTAVESGRWTDDPVAAAFLGDVAPPRHLRPLYRVSSSYAFGRGARAAVRELDPDRPSAGESA